MYYIGCPQSIELFINKKALDFSDMENEKSVFAFQLTNINETVNVPIHKFQNVNHITV
jgi:hypothetical protein